MEAGTPPGAGVGIQGRDGGLRRDSEAEPGEGLTDGDKEGGERKRRQDGAQVSGPSNGEGRAGEERGRGWGEHVWGRMGTGKSALDLGVLRRWLVVFRRQLTYKSGACRKKLGVFGI